MPGLFEVQNVVINRELIFAGVLRNVMDVANVMAFGSEGAYEKVDVYHGCKFRVTECPLGCAPGWGDTILEVVM